MREIRREQDGQARVMMCGSACVVVMVVVDEKTGWGGCR